jgi:hypothetical protein
MGSQEFLRSLKRLISRNDRAPRLDKHYCQGNSAIDLPYSGTWHLTLKTQLARGGYSTINKRQF